MVLARLDCEIAGAGAEWGRMHGLDLSIQVDLSINEALRREAMVHRGDRAMQRARADIRLDPFAPFLRCQVLVGSILFGPAAALPTSEVELGQAAPVRGRVQPVSELMGVNPLRFAVRVDQPIPLKHGAAAALRYVSRRIPT